VREERPSSERSEMVKRLRKMKDEQEVDHRQSENWDLEVEANLNQSNLPLPPMASREVGSRRSLWTLNDR